MTTNSVASTGLHARFPFWHIADILLGNLNWLNAKGGPMTWGQIGWFVAMGIRRIAKRMHLEMRKNSHPLRVLIEASAGVEDNKTKSRWVRALKYANGWLQPPDRLTWFFNVNGGISGSAAKYAKLQRSKKFLKGNTSENGGQEPRAPDSLEPGRRSDLPASKST